MNKKTKLFFKNIGIFQTIISLIIIIIFIFDSLVPSVTISLGANTFYNWLIICILFISSTIYLFKYNPRDVKHIEESKEYKKIISLVRECEYTLSLIIVFASFYRLYVMLNFLPQISPGIRNIIVLLITIRLYFSVISIAIGLKKWVLLLLIIIGIPLVYLVGVFDIRWWALISGIMIIWNFVNSKDFLILLNRGKEINKIPERLNFIWQRNKIVFYTITTLVYLVLIISSFFETEKMDIWDKSNVRLWTLVGFMMVCLLMSIITLCFKYLYERNKVFQEIVEQRKQDWFFIKLTNIIGFYTKYHKMIIKLSNKKE